MNKYPYYIPVYFDAGILCKYFKDKKFNSWSEALNAMKLRSEGLAKITGYNAFLHSQTAILEYTDNFTGSIVTIYNNGNMVAINEPLNP